MLKKTRKIRRIKKAKKVIKPARKVRVWIKPDKCQLAEEVRCFCVSWIMHKGRGHASREAFAFPDEVFVTKDPDSGERTVFILTTLLKSRFASAEKIPVPLYMVACKPHYKTRIIKRAALKEIAIGIKDFYKSQIAMTSEERLEFTPVSVSSPVAIEEVLAEIEQETQVA